MKKKKEGKELNGVEGRPGQKLDPDDVVYEGETQTLFAVKEA